MPRFWKVPTLEVVPSAGDILGYRAPGGQVAFFLTHFRTQSTPTSPFEKQASLDPVPNGSDGSAVSWSGDGKIVAFSGYVGKIWLYEYPSGKLLKSFDNSIKYGLPIALSPDAKMIIAVGSEEIGLYRTENGELIKKVASKNGPYDLGLAYSPDGQFLAMGTTRGFVQIWKSDLSAVVHEFRAHAAGVRSLLWSHDGRLLVTGSHNNSGHGDFLIDDLARDPTIRFWNPLSGESLGTILVHRFNDHLAVTPAGHYRIAPMEFERDLVYIVQTAEGQLTLTPGEFEQRFGWKNDPETVRLDRQP